MLAQLEDGWLRDQALGLRTYAGVLAGEGLSYSDEVERCYGVRPERVSTDVYAAVHERLDELLPPGGRPRRALRGLAAGEPRSRRPGRSPLPGARSASCAQRTAAIVDLPAGEALEIDEVRDEPWWAFNYYQGDLRSRVVVNLDVPTTRDDIVELVAHEVYPGHHTEHSVKEQLLLRDQGLLEESIQLVPIPASLVSEGIAETGPDLVVDERRRGAHHCDLRLARARVRPRGRRARSATARRPMRRIGLDAALMIHEDGASEEEAKAHVRRWALSTPEQAAHSVRFVTDPTWRALRDQLLRRAGGRARLGPGRSRIGSGGC